MRERTIEEHLRDEVKYRGGVALKLKTSSGRGWPDRLVLLPIRRIAFVELKAPGRVATKLQMVRIRFLRGIGFTALVIDTKEAVDVFLDTF